MDAVRISNERRFLTFEITDEQGEVHTYTIPLLTSLPASYIRRIADAARLSGEEQESAYLDIQFDILEHYAPGITDSATAADLKQIMDLWVAATEDEGGVSLGESSASPS